MNRNLQQMLSGGSLPSLPQVAQRVIEVAQAPEPDFRELIRVIRTDPAICSRLLATVNSALFGLRRRISSIEEAIPVLGTNLVRTLVLSFSLTRCYGRAVRFETCHQRLWRLTLAQAVSAEALAEQVRGADASVWFLAALIQDVGRLALLQEHPADYARLTQMLGDSAALLRAEREAFGFDHVALSVGLAERWRLDPELIAAVAAHHRTDELRGVTKAPGSHQERLARALLLAGLIGEELELLREAGAPRRDAWEPCLVSWFDIPRTEVDVWLSEIDRRVREVAALFAVNVGEPAAVADLLTRAHTTVAEIAIQSQLEAVAMHREAERTQQELSRLRSRSQELERQAGRDALTGVEGRVALPQEISRLAEHCQASGQWLGVFFLDVDRFKLVNDRYGHPAGDELLRVLARQLRDTLRATDFLCRYGGDEFVVVMATTERSLLLRVAERMRAAASRVTVPGQPQLGCSTSVGLALWHPTISAAVPALDQLLLEADQAMYEAKRAGGDRVVAVSCAAECPLPAR